MKIYEAEAIHCADETFEPGRWTLCGRASDAMATVTKKLDVRPSAEFDHTTPSQRCDLCDVQRRLIVRYST